jgi:hypothetical protein
MGSLFETSVRSINLLQFLDWAAQSFLEQGPDTKLPYGRLSLPPIQRDAVWKADQVENLWDSVLRGLPVGTFMLQKREKGDYGRVLSNKANVEAQPTAGWDLLDGQQRLRSLLLGLHGPSMDGNLRDLRCLWIDLRDPTKFKLRMTSSAQPFGYDPNGNRLPPNKRSDARERYERDDFEITLDDRFAYTHELFSNFIERPTNLYLKSKREKLRLFPDNYLNTWPPMPDRMPDSIDNVFATQSSLILPLHILLRAYRSEAPTAEFESLRRHLDEQNFYRIKRAIRCLGLAEIALIDASSVTDPDDLRLLFDRIGAGGTPLSNDDRLFSLYKSVRPTFHNVVRQINENDGNVVSATKIAVSAIRIANALVHAGNGGKNDQGNDAPDIIKFIEEARNVAESPLFSQLDEICPVGSNTVGKFSRIFHEVFSKLRYHGENNERGIPGVMFGQLPTQLIQTLLFWKIQPSQRLDNEDNDILRFALGWLLIVANNDKAARECFRMIREASDLSLKSLFLKLSENSSISLKLITPSDMRKFLTMSSEEVLWPYTDERVKKIIPEEFRVLSDETWRVGNLIRKWWNGAAIYLPWLQRRYLAAAFPEYDPTADRDDDTPYDIDHMIPAKSWGDTWNLDHFPGIKSQENKKRFQWSRHDIGNSIGNKWLVDMSSNRQWQDKQFHYKLAEIRANISDRGSYQSLLDVAFNAEAEALWGNASKGEVWSDDRMLAFQQAIEHRTAWLYEKFYTDIGFCEWLGTYSENSEGNE